MDGVFAEVIGARHGGIKHEQQQVEGDGLLDSASLATGLEPGRMMPFALEQNDVVKGTHSRLVGIAEDDVFVPRRFAQFVGA